MYFRLVGRRDEDGEDAETESGRARYSDADFQEDLRRVTIAERWQGLRQKNFNLLRQKILLALTVGLTLFTAYSAARGFQTSVPIAAGSGSVAIGVASLIESRRKPKSGE